MAERREGEPVRVLDRKATVLRSEMPEEMTATAVEYCNQALDRLKEGIPSQERDVAKHVKEQFDKQYGACWHCAFGSHYGMHVSYEAGKFLYFTIGPYNLVLWKHM
eukprot:GGOE01013704.1.p2 GENE.GGOE01013704.1~~GGOE01013704.1.p2  ORF type:complete len:106 (-),score=33.58 GGOE01013704.1:210-527(-)